MGGEVMADLLRLLAGRRSCPWCGEPREDSIGDWITDRLPDRVVCALARYDELVMRIGVPLHGRLHERPTPQAGT